MISNHLLLQQDTIQNNIQLPTGMERPRMNRNLFFFSCLILLISLGRHVQAQKSPLSESLGNFTLEILFHTITTAGEDSNLILSPTSIWGLLLVLSKVSSGITSREIKNAIRVRSSETRFSSIWQTVDGSSAFEMQKLNAIFADKDILLLRDFVSDSPDYGVNIISVNISDNSELNQQSLYPKLKLFSINDMQPRTLMPITAANLKGEWKFSFDTYFTTKQPFYDTKGKKIGQVNMMYNRHTYPVTNIDILKARAIEIPYSRGQFSMIILLPYTNVTLKEVLYGFLGGTFDTVITELDRVKDFKEEVLAVVPRFKIISNSDMKSVLNMLGMYSLFSAKASLPYVARTPTYVGKFLHNIEIDVTESGTYVSKSMNSVLGTRVGVTSFIANKPFLYFIFEKTTKAIAFCGQYQVPVLY